MSDMITSLICRIYCRKLDVIKNVVFHWLTSGFMQLAAAGRRLNVLNFYCLFEEKILQVH